MVNPVIGARTVPDPLEPDLSARAMVVFYSIDVDASHDLNMSEFEEVFGSQSLVALRRLVAESGGAVTPEQWIRFLAHMHRAKGASSSPML